MLMQVLTLSNLKFLFKGLQLTIYISVATIVISMIFGTILGVLRASSKGIGGKLAGIYIEVLRNTPLLLWILATRFIVDVKPVYSGILSLSLFTSAIIGEIVRGGLNSVSRGQYEAAYAQGFNKVQALWYIVLPQAFKNMIPAILSQFITVIKDTSFLWAVGIEEVTGKGMILMGGYGNSVQVFTLFGLLAVMYFILNFMISLIGRSQQARFS